MAGILEALQNALRGTYNGLSGAGEDMARGVADAVTLPRDVYQGRVNVDPNTMGNADFGRVLNLAGNVAGGGITTGAAPAGSLGMFMGQTARMAPTRMAEGLAAGEAAGLSPETIYAATAGKDRTGVFRGNDGVPRFEVSDSGANLNLRPIEGGQNAQLQDVLDHPQLFANYPELRRMPVKALSQEQMEQGLYGYFRNGGDRAPSEIGVNTARSQDDVRGTLLHEIQHYIQNQEGFATGSNPAAPDITRASPVRRAEVAFDRANYALAETKMARDHAVSNGYPDNVLQGLHDRYAQADTAANDAWKHLNDLKFGAYARAGGEVEARTTQARQDMPLVLRQQEIPTEWAGNQVTYDNNRINYLPSQQWKPGKTLPFPADNYPRGWLPGNF